MENQESKNCTVKLTGKDGGGTYHLVIGDNDSWKYVEGEITDNQQINLVVNSEDIYWQMLKRDFQSLGINIATIDNRNILSTIDAYINFRAANKNYKLSEEIIDNLKTILKNKNVSTVDLNNTYNKALSAKSLVDTNLRLITRNGTNPQYSAAITYDQANKLMAEGKNYAANYLAYKLFGIVWK